MSDQICAHLRYHFRIPKPEWDKRKYSQEQIMEMYYEFYFVKEQLGEIKKD